MKSLVFLTGLCVVRAFIGPIAIQRPQHQRTLPSGSRNRLPIFLSNQEVSYDDMDDETLLKEVSISMLRGLCEQYSLSKKGTKKDMLLRLRQFAAEQQELERQRLAKRVERVEAGGINEREKFEFLEARPGDEQEEEPAYFYYQSLEPDPKKDKSVKKENDAEKKSKPSESPEAEKMNNYKNHVTVPPPPAEAQPNEHGEREVTIYSTYDHNDLTGVSAAQPGQAAVPDPMVSDMGKSQIDTWEDTKVARSKTSKVEINAAKEAVIELVSGLLQSTGAPAFQHDPEDLAMLGVTRRSAFTSPEGFVGFDPSKVSNDMLKQASRALRTDRGRVLDEVLGDFELRAVGQDGPAGDDKGRGGGHYREVSKVRVFLEGFRKAEVRRLARETTSILLDKLVSEGIEGLDITLATMSRGSDDTSDVAGELNDSLIDFLNDAIRQQEKKVDLLVAQKDQLEQDQHQEKEESPEETDRLDKLWTVKEENGNRIETLDMNDKENRAILKEEFDRAQAEDKGLVQPIPQTPPEQLLLLLVLLRDRLKTEAAFGFDEKARNLRVLAYCMKLPTDKLRKELIHKEMGSSVDRVDSFLELVASSIEYAESTSYQLRPSRGQLLNPSVLNKILALGKEVRSTILFQASGMSLNSRDRGSSVF